MLAFVELLPEEDQSKIVEKTFSLVEKAENETDQIAITKKIVANILVILLSFGGLIFCFWLMGSKAPTNVNEKLLLSFAIISSFVLNIGAILTLIMLTFNGRAFYELKVLNYMSEMMEAVVDAEKTQRIHDKLRERMPEMVKEVEQEVIAEMSRYSAPPT